MTTSEFSTARRLIVSGRVQGVGFRPFVFRLARELGLVGAVRNRAGDVEITVQGPNPAIRDFAVRLIADAPPLARPQLDVSESHAIDSTLQAFAIEASETAAQARVFVPPDLFVCDDCRAELGQHDDRRHAYPFINCTQCGPRYTVIERMPYDRENTTMSEFPLCPTCRAEYTEPNNRRFHAEPLACPECGPHIWLELGDSPRDASDAAALDRAVALLRAGAIVAVKGVGGYHLLCDARSSPAVLRLRARKRRPDKPLAVMFPLRGEDGLDAVRDELDPTPSEAAALMDVTRPIVLVRRRAGTRLPEAIGPLLGEVGAMLPYSPLHVMLLDALGGPVVATSGNVSGEPVLTDTAMAAERLRSVADAWLHHNRRIARPADDAVVREIAMRSRAVRLGRGSAPLEMRLVTPVERPVVAIGGHLKTTVGLAWGDRIVVSPHIGTMDRPRSVDVLQQVVLDLQHLYGVEAETMLCDAHGGYGSTRWARSSGMPTVTIGHHRAHASAVFGEAVVSGQHAPDRDMIVLTWDGVGLGDDGDLWGGETFIGQPGTWRRVASFEPFALPGGDAVAREPWRSGASLAWSLGVDTALGPVDSRPIVHHAWLNGINAPRTSAVGRLFDGFAALALGVSSTSFEGQAPMHVEAVATQFRGAIVPLGLPVSVASGLRRIDWAPLVQLALDPERSREERAASFHASLVACAVRECEHQRSVAGVTAVGLAGGVFQNRLLSEALIHDLASRGFSVLLGERVPANDGGLSFGQIVEYAARSIQ